MMGNEGISVADAIALRDASNGSYGNGSGMWGDNGAWWVIILILFLGGGAWGRGGYGGNNGSGNDGGANFFPYFAGYNSCCTPATTQGVTDAFNFNQLDNGIRGLERGLCDGFYNTAMGISNLGSQLQNCCCQTQLGMTQGFNGVNQSISNLGFQVQQGFCGVDKTIMQGDFHNQAGFNSLANQLAACCCDIGRGQDALKYDLAANTNALLVANERNTDRIINYLTQNEMDKLRTELQSAQFQLSQLSQTSNIVNQLMPVAKPAYLTCSPYASAFGFNYTNNCGCNPCNTCCA